MAINFPSNPSNGDTHAGFTYNSTVGAWESTAATPVTQATLDGYLQVANSSSGTTVYSAISDLPLSGNESGAQAYVSGTNRLYLWTGSGWYNIALINTNPSLSGASATYNLNNDGSNTVVTLASTDPEGLPISFSVSHSGIGVGANAIATVTQSNNIFTFTPTTNTELGGTFTTTFTASDGVNVAVANSSFTLAFSVNNGNYTTALITSVGTNNQVNNTFVDSSSFNRTITTYGNATQSTFSPYRSAGYSTYFDGSGDYLSLAYDSSFSFPAGTDFTMEAWVYPADATTQTIFSSYPGAGTGNWLWIITTANRLSLYIYPNATFSYWTPTGADVTPNTWNHVALTRSGTTWSMFVNGALAGSVSATQDMGTGSNPLLIGQNQSGSYFNGYIAEARIVKGTAVYTSAFTPPTERLTSITNTSLLTCHLPYIVDGSTNGHSITSYGNTSTKPFTHYDVLTYDASIDGGSMYFDGTGDYSTVAADTTNLTLNGDFTIDFWVYPTTSQSTSYVFGKYNNNSDGWGIFVTTDWSSGNFGSLTFYYGNHGQNESATNLRDQKIKVNQWSHCRITRESNVFYMAINGVVGTRYNYNTVLSWSDSRTFNADTPIGIGGVSNIPAQQGVISDLRVIKGTALTTTNFTPPTAPLTAVTNTSLLVNGTNAGIIDKSQSVSTITLNGDVKSSTTQTKYLPSSMYFDGTGDYISIPATKTNDFGVNDFTLEAWIYFNSVGNANLIMAGDGSVTNGYYWRYNSSQLQFGIQLVGNVAATSWTPNSSQWYHIAVTREGTSLKQFVDGTQLGSTTTNSTNFADGLTWIGTGGSGSFNGHMSDVRITKGLARYTSNFTPPTAALQG